MGESLNVTGHLRGGEVLVRNGLGLEGCMPMDLVVRRKGVCAEIPVVPTGSVYRCCGHTFHLPFGWGEQTFTTGAATSGSFRFGCG